MRAVAYLRVSSLSQVEGHSMDAQERLFREYCKHHNHEVVDIYREEGRSAHVEEIGKRTELCRLLADAKKRNFDVVIVHTLDRWARKLRVTLETLKILSESQVGFVSLTESLDWSTPEGRLTAHMLGMLAEFYSDSLGKHVRKGIDQRAFEGKHNGTIPFGYDSCWINENGEKKRICNPEHPGGIHLNTKESEAVKELFNRYATGNTTLSQLADWLNENGFRTRNTSKSIDPVGNVITGPRIFTTASVRGILHNPFYIGKLRHKGKILPGVHEAIVSEEIFDLVQITTKKNSSRSETLNPKPQREYLLKGIIHCAYCGMPMWAETYTSNGRRYYREHKNSRSIGVCPLPSGSIPCEVADEQVIRLVSAIKLRPDWFEEVLAIISMKDQAEQIRQKRERIQESLKRTAKTYRDNLMTDSEYEREKKLYQMELDSLVLPEADAAEKAGKLILDLPRLWEAANLTERRKLLVTMLDAVYVDSKHNLVVAVKPKPPFRPVFQVAAESEGSIIEIRNGSENQSQNPNLFLVEAGESRTPPETMLCFV